MASQTTTAIPAEAASPTTRRVPSSLGTITKTVANRIVWLRYPVIERRPTLEASLRRPVSRPSGAGPPAHRVRSASQPHAPARPKTSSTTGSQAMSLPPAIQRAMPTALAAPMTSPPTATATSGPRCLRGSAMTSVSARRAPMNIAGTMVEATPRMATD